MLCSCYHGSPAVCLLFPCSMPAAIARAVSSMEKKFLFLSCPIVTEAMNYVGLLFLPPSLPSAALPFFSFFPFTQSFLSPFFPFSLPPSPFLPLYLPSFPSISLLPSFLPSFFLFLKTGLWALSSCLPLRLSYSPWSPAPSLFSFSSPP